MTALAQYQRLEAAGTWRPGPLAQRREVIVSFGDATLVLSDPRSEVPLSHWSLPAVTRLNPARMPAIYAPDATGDDEQLELSDTDMIAAIDKVHRVIEQSRPHPGRLRGTGMIVLAVAMLGAAAWWLPGAMQDYAVRIAQPAQRAAIGGQILADMTRVTGPACNRPAPSDVLDRLAPRLLGQGARLAVLPAPMAGARPLPGSIVVVGQDLLQPGEVARDAAMGHILAASTAARADDPLAPALDAAGPRAVVDLLTRGSLPATSLAGYGERVIAAPEPRAEDDALLARFAEAGVPSEPYARDLDPSGESTLPLIEADPFRTALPASPVLSEEEWASLITICDQ